MSVAAICLASVCCSAAKAFYVYDYIDRTGKACIKGVRAMEEHDAFDERKDFHNGRALRSNYRINYYFDPPYPKCASAQGLFFIDKSNSESIGPYSWAQSFSGGIAPVILPSKDPKEQVISLIDTSGKIVGRTNLQLVLSRERPALAKFEPFCEGLAAVLAIPAQSSTGKLVAKWGFIDSRGKWLLEPQFETASNFSDGLSCVRVGIGSDDISEQDKPKSWGYINSAGKFVIEPVYGYASQFSEKLASVRQLAIVGGGQKQAFSETSRHFDKAGVERPSAGPGLSRDLRQGGNLSAKLDDRESVSDSTISELTNQPPVGESCAGDTQEPELRVVYSVINTLGEIQFSNPNAELAEPYSNGLSLLAGKASYMDAKGQIVIDGKDFSEARSFSDGLACVKVAATGKYGFIDKRGRLVIPANFERAGDFSEGLAPVLVNKLWGFIDRSGKTVIPPRYLSVRPFSDGLAAAVTRRFSRHEKRKQVQRCLFDLVDPLTNEVRAQCNLVQVPGNQRMLISSLETSSWKSAKAAGSIVSEGGYAALRDSSGQSRELLLRGRPTVGVPARTYGKVKLVKSIAFANLAVYQPPEGLPGEGLDLSSTIPKSTEIFGDTEQNQLVLNCGVGSRECYISGARADLLDVKLRPTARGGRTVGGEALLNSDGELLGIAVKYELLDSKLSIQCLPSTLILRHLSELDR